MIRYGDFGYSLLPAPAVHLVQSTVPHITFLAIRIRRQRYKKYNSSQTQNAVHIFYIFTILGSQM